MAIKRDLEADMPDTAPDEGIVEAVGARSGGAAIQVTGPQFALKDGDVEWLERVSQASTTI